MDVYHTLHTDVNMRGFRGRFAVVHLFDPNYGSTDRHALDMNYSPGRFTELRLVVGFPTSSSNLSFHSLSNF
jgi:hypothetical protein